MLSQIIEINYKIFANLDSSQDQEEKESRKVSNIKFYLTKRADIFLQYLLEQIKSRLN
jgi:hypothetical protein